MEHLKEAWESLIALIPVIFLAAVGGAVSSLNRPKDEFSWWFFLIGIVTAVFVGLVIHFLLQTTDLQDGIQSAAIAISGYASRDVLYLLKKYFLNKAKKELS